MTSGEKIALARCGLFSGMAAAERERMLSCLEARQETYRRGDVIWRIGDSVPACAVVLSGQVRGETVDRTGSRTVTAFHSPGSLVGDVLMATPGGKSPVYVIAAKDSSLLFLSYRAIMGGCSRCCSCHTVLRENLMAELARKYWQQRRRTGYLSARSLRQRIAMYLLDCAGQADSFSTGTGREDMAGLLGVNRSAMCRELGRMKHDGIIDFRKDDFRISDREALIHFAQQ